jgi:DNA-binding transcriptional MerR regulator
MQIGTVAKKLDLSVDAIRFYKRNALLPRAPRTAGGFRQYAEGDIETLGFLRRAQGLGFTLGEVRELLELRQSRVQPCAPYAAGWNRNSWMCMASSQAYKNWNSNCGWPSAAANERCTNNPVAARSCAGKANPSEECGNED